MYVCKFKFVVIRISPLTSQYSNEPLITTVSSTPAVAATTAAAATSVVWSPAPVGIVARLHRAIIGVLLSVPVPKVTITVPTPHLVVVVVVAIAPTVSASVPTAVTSSIT